jgi:hypothetical protein
MNKKLGLIFLILAVALIVVNVSADDGPLYTRNLSRTPDTETSGAQISFMHLYVPAQNTQGELLEGDTAIEYPVGDCTSSDTSGCTIVDTMAIAKPLIATYEDGIVEEEDDPSIFSPFVINTGTGFAKRDAYASISLDDGATWKDTNLSNSADRSSFNLANGYAYPGDVFRINHTVVGNKIAVAWISRFCESGSPLYSWEDEDKDAFLEAYPDLINPIEVEGIAEPYEMYTDDLFGVAGSQGSVDYLLQGFPEVGEIPYGCVWVARGTLEPVDPETGDYTAGSDNYGIIWRTPERLTSGRRDANRVDITGTSGAGFIVSWQEDPDGLRPGKGLGPGEGWSGAIANAKTDIWYSHIAWDDFDAVCTDEVDGYCTPGEIPNYSLDAKPKIAVPFAVPMRLTDNSQCKATQQFGTDGSLINPYCYADFDANGTADLCAAEVSWTNPGGTTLNLCQTEDGRVLDGRTSSTRVRWAIKPYITDPDGNPETDDGEVSAWVTMAMEKMKAMGTETVTGCDPQTDPDCEPIDIGKDMWYHTFEWNKPEVAAQGLMLNAPAVDYETGENFPVFIDEWGNEYWETEIARRFNLIVQGIGGAMASESNTSALLIYKEGILFQGGPADIFIRRIELPDDFDPAVDNPFAYENVQCVEYDDSGNATPVDLLYPDGSNPNYVRGLCPVQGMNVSGTTIVECDDGSSGQDCADSFPWDPDVAESGYPKVTEWVQAVDNYNDPSWTNPYDVSKGHRGFIDGDFVMMMYATAPNWKANTTGNEAYNLYIRRSFDGGQTWTTLPADFPGVDGISVIADGTTTCEDYGWGGQIEEEVCTTYGPGEFEQARNVSRLVGSKTTVLDPRYTPTGGMLKYDYSNLVCDDDRDGIFESCGYDEANAPHFSEVRDPSAYFVTYEVGDNTVVTVEQGAVPMDMYYSKASNFGDDYYEIDVCGEDYPGTPSVCSDGESELLWDWLENKEPISEEASVTASPAGDRFYSVWNQELEIGPDEYTDMDIEFRRIYFNVTDVDVAPSATILYVSSTAADYDDADLVFAGTGRDHDNNGAGVVDYRWTSSLDGILSSSKSFTIPVNEFTTGLHTISFTVRDDEGNWAAEKTTTLFVAEDLTQINLPVVFR